MQKFCIMPPPIYVDSLELIEELLKVCLSEKVVAIDTETLGFKEYNVMEDQALYMGISPNKNTRYFVPRKLLHYIKPLLIDDRIIKVFHNFKFDAHRIENTIGVRVQGPIADTAIFHALLDSESSHKLDYLSSTMYEIPMAEYKVIMKSSNPFKVRPGHLIWEKFLDYGSLDALVTRMLYDDLSKALLDIKIDKSTSMMDYYIKHEEPQMLALYEMERKGVRLNMPLLEEWRISVENESNRIRGEICKELGEPLFNKDGSPFNPSSSQQCAKLLYETLKLPVIKRTASGRPAADADTLEELSKQVNNDLLNRIVEYRKLIKLKSTYADAYTKANFSGRIHTKFNCVGTATGRLSSSDPNLQNVPPIARRLFIPDEGYVFIGADYSQLELRIVAHYSQEEDMMNAFHTGKDVHLVNVSKMNNVAYDVLVKRKSEKDPWVKQARDGSKAVVYGLSYGAGARRTAQSMSAAFGREVDLPEAQETLDKYFNTFPKVASMMSRMIRSAKKHGFSRTLLGRRRSLPHINSGDRGLKAGAERAALNAPIQGTAADITKCALIRCWRSNELKALGVQALLQIHDELIFQVPEQNVIAASRIIQQLMEDPFEGKTLTIKLPANPSVGKDWSEIK